MQLLVVNPSTCPLPSGMADVIAGGSWSVTTAQDYQSAVRAASEQSIDAVVLAEPQAGLDAAETDAFQRLLRILDGQPIAGVLLTDRKQTARALQEALVDPVSASITADELRGRLSTIERYQTMLKRVEREIHNMERLAERLDRHFREIDEEMRLAAKLQRDFLPKVDGQVGPLRFATIYRPASWVSGDIFDIIPLDENHTAFYVADAVGHGVAASLLTMFIKRSIVPTRAAQGGTIIASPSEVIEHLNTALADQALPNCQFVTACYGVIDHRTLTLSYARGGHPYPLHASTHGVVEEVQASGGLLGLFKQEKFPTTQRQLARGDKLVFYTDGVELAFPASTTTAPSPPPIIAALTPFAAAPIQEMFKEIESRLDSQSGSLTPQDDITILGVELLS